MKIDLSKRLRTVVRDLASKAHEREMRQLLMPLSESFSLWRKGKRDTWEVLHEIDQLTYPRRRLSERYEAASLAPMIVAFAIVMGILRDDEVPDEVQEALKKPIAFYRQGVADGTISFEEED